MSVFRDSLMDISLGDVAFDIQTMIEDRILTISMLDVLHQSIITWRRYRVREKFCTSVCHVERSCFDILA